MKRRPPPRWPAGLVGTVMRPVVAAFEAAIRAGSDVDPFQRDPDFVARVLPALRAVNLYFGTDIRGWERVPPSGPFLIVGNHSGGAETNDLWFLLTKWVAERGPRAPLYALAYDLMFAYPGMSTLLRRLGVVPATMANGRRALAMGAAVAAFPGGDSEVFRPWHARNRIDFGGHVGFVRLAIQAGVPVVPMTIHGAHQSTFVLTRGRWLARLMGIERLHVNVFPFVWNVPFGVTPAFVPSIQLPAKVTIEMGEPLDWSHYGPGAARDRALLERCYDEVTGTMQRTLDRLAAERPHPVLERLGELRPDRVIRSLAGW